MLVKKKIIEDKDEKPKAKDVKPLYTGFLVCILHLDCSEIGDKVVFLLNKKRNKIILFWYYFSATNWDFRLDDLKTISPKK